jgi:hypothetical protein
LTVPDSKYPLFGTASRLLAAEPTRRVFFSFHYQRDIQRVQQIRQHWVTKETHKAAGYFDGSLEEKARTEGATAVKRLINGSLFGCSVLCVIIGAETFTRRWVLYEIFKAISDGMGVFGIRTDGMKTMDGSYDAPAVTPFQVLRYDAQPIGVLQPCVFQNGQWFYSADNESTSRAKAKALNGGTSLYLADRFPVYHWLHDNGRQNFSAWAAEAARQAGRQ